MSELTFLPNLLDQTFDILQSGWLGILCISVLGPVLEELLFRGAITKELLRRYSPAKAIFPSESGSDNRCLPHRFLACLALL